MHFLLDVRVISSNYDHSHHPWVFPSSSDGDGEKDSFNGSLRSGSGTSYRRTTRERYWKAKYALYLVGPRHNEESSNDKTQRSSGEGEDEKQKKMCNDNNVALRDSTAVVEEGSTTDDGCQVACLLSVPFTCSVGDLLDAVSNGRTWVVEEVHIFFDPAEDGYKYCASITFADSHSADSFVKVVRGWKWQDVDGSSIKAVLLMEPPRISMVGVRTPLVASPDGGHEEQKSNDHQSCYSQNTCNDSIGPSKDTGDALGLGVVLMVETEQDRKNVESKSQQPNASMLEETGNNHVRELPMCPVCLDCLDPLALGLFPEPTMKEVLEQRNASDVQLENSEVVTTSGDFSPPGRRGCCRKRRRQGPGSLRMWSGSTCTVCKILSTRDQGQVGVGGVGEPDHQEEQKIFCNDGDCSIAHNLWLCLICCHIGCGRYTNEHAKRHFNVTGHSYSLELSTGRVWDYYGDHFIHRILRKRVPRYDTEFNTFGDMDETEVGSSGNGGWYSSSLHQQPELLLPHSPSSSSSAKRNSTTVLKEKFARVAHDYEELLANQLHVQAEYYENLIAKMTAANAENRAVASETIADKLSDKEEAEVVRLRRDMSCLNESHETAMRSLREAQGEAERLRAENTEMIRSQHNCKNHTETIMRAVTSSEMKNRRIVAELNRQLQDLNFYLRAQAEVQSSSQREDLEKGRVITEEEETIIDDAASFSSSSSSMPHGSEILIQPTYQLTRHHSASSDTARERLQRRLSEKRRTRSHV